MAHLSVERRSISMQKWAGLLFDRVGECLIREKYPIDGWTMRTGEYHPDGYVFEDDGMHPIREGEVWGGPDSTGVFHCDFTVPRELEGKEVFLYLLTPAEVLVSENGRYLDGIDPNRAWFPYLERAVAGEAHSLDLEVYTRSKPDDDRAPAVHNRKGCLHPFSRPCLIVPDREMLALHYDLQSLYQAAYAPHMAQDVQEYLQARLAEVVRKFPLFDCSEKELRRQAPELRRFIRENVMEKSTPFGKPGRLACVAHSHLDIAYHWRVEQTVQKNARTVLIQLRLMDRHPEFSYAHSQAWTYEQLKRYYPQLFDEVKKRVAEGRWEVVGGMYVEPDCNLTSAESLTRQILYGKAFFRKEFSIDVDNAWLPDVFGNSAIMPQILRGSGIRYFVSNKMSTWNDTNRFPHNNFIWRGLDGSEVFACVPPVHFITWMDPDQAVEHWEKFQDKESCGESLQMYGYGDGGSGATDGMVEMFHREQQLPGIPQMRLTTGREYLHSVFDGAKGLATWDGDLYLEMHRGTFTTKAVLKQHNRRGEFAAQDTEALLTAASLVPGGKPAPQRELTGLWKKLLLNQFHDILPGSHTAPVCEDALAAYRSVGKGLRELRGKAWDILAPADAGAAAGFSVFNPLSDGRDGCARLPEEVGPVEALTDAAGNPVPVQKQQKPDGGSRLVAAVRGVPGLGFASFTAAQGKASAAPADLTARASDDAFELENRFFRLTVDCSGAITGCWDKRARTEVAAPGARLNEWQLFEDCSGLYNAWDIVRTYTDHPIRLPDWSHVEIVESGPVSVAVRMSRDFSRSRAVQIIRLYADRPRIDFETWVDWHEDQKLLKVAFPVRVKSHTYTTDTSAGVMERMNNRNTSWEQAKFEVPCHKWVDISEGLFGVALMNDCKYGCDVVDNTLRLSLLRAPIRPDIESDRGTHTFTYSLFPHGGNWQASGLAEEAYDLNVPLRLTAGRIVPPERRESVLTVGAGALKCQALKRAEDESGDVVLRLVEVYGSHGRTAITARFPFGKAVLCNLLEEEEKPCDRDGQTVYVDYRPNQIITVRFCR